MLTLLVIHQNFTLMCGFTHGNLLCSMLQGIPNVAVYIDDPLVTGKRPAASVHPQTCPPSNRCSKTCKNMSKCAFICLSVEYLGHIVSAKGMQHLIR